MREYIIDLAAHNASAAMALCDGVHGEIVRCKDCNHGLFNGRICDRLDPDFDERWFEVEPDGFCAWPERKEELNDATIERR